MPVFTDLRGASAGIPGIPRLSTAQTEALDLLAAVADEECLCCPFQEGDIQLLNNHVVFHGRTAYEDECQNQKRTAVAAPLAGGAEFTAAAGRT